MTDRDIYTPSRLNREVRLHLEGGFPAIWIEGEISNLFRPASGHIYFTLKDQQAQLKCALFRNRNPYGRIRPEDGQQVLVRGRLSLYEPRGEFQLIADHLEPAGEGLLRRQFEALKRKLAAEGLMESARKRPLPRFPRHIAVVTSPTGAAIQDVISVIGRRYPPVRLTVVASAVQGPQAVPELLSGLAAAQSLGPDLILLTRGGGSLEDLWSFNDEALARAIADSGIPVVCAVGHEIDFCIAELVADQRAPTPSAAAELMVPDRMELLQRLSQLQRALISCTRSELERREQRYDRDRRRLERLDPRLRLQEANERLGQLRRWVGRCAAEAVRLSQLRWQGMDRRLRTRDPRQALLTAQQQRQLLTQRLVRAAQLRLDHCRKPLQTTAHQLNRAAPLGIVDRHTRGVVELRQRLTRLTGRGIQERRLQLDALHRSLAAVSPQAVLDRGYSMTTSAANGQIVRNAMDVQPGDRLRTRLAQGTIDSIAD